MPSLRDSEKWEAIIGHWVKTQCYLMSSLRDLLTRLKRNEWNIFGGTFYGGGEIPIVSVFNGESEIVDSIPAFRIKTASMLDSAYYFGKPAFDSDSNYHVAKRCQRVPIKSTAQDTAEVLHVDLTIRKARE